MKKAFPFVLGGVLLILLVVVMTSNTTRPFRRLDERITLRERDKIPYGTRVARQLLPSLFPGAHVLVDNRAPGAWDSISTIEPNQAVILPADYFDAEPVQLAELSRFAERGNSVFIICRAASDDVASFFNLVFNEYAMAFSPGPLSDSLHLNLQPPLFPSTKNFTYPGRKYDGTIRVKDSVRTLVLGRNERAQVNFVRLDKGEGHFFIHTAPLAFSNYFILHKGNAAYYEQALSVLPKDVETIVWDEYYLQKPNDNKDPNWLGALLSYPSFKWGLLIGAATLALYILLGMRRRQRMIPPHPMPKNDSLDFVKTLGRLYYDRKDHKNLAEKMATYFLEHVRSRYKLPTHALDDVFVQALHYKSAYPEPEIKAIINSIHAVRNAGAVSEEQLSDFHKQLELFYQNT